MVEKKWVIQKNDREAALRLAAGIGVHPLTAALLIARGHSTAEAARRFLEPSSEQLHNPLLLKGMSEAVERILKAVDTDEKILIWGDYDVDGTTGTVLLRKCIKLLGGQSEFHIPDRFTEGYGVNIPALAEAQERGCSLAISVDCGTRSFEPIAWAKANGMDFIVTDHHLADDEMGLPDAFAVVNPNQPECTYPEKNLAGVGVAYKLAQALLDARGRGDECSEFLKIAAIGTIADIMHLTGENRPIVAAGLRDLRDTNNFGLKALMEVADCRSEMTSYHIGFRIGPRINAAGRMDAGRQVVELLECDDFNLARKLAATLDTRNRERQTVQQTITEAAIRQSEEQKGDRFVVVAGENWHRGVIGLAASRVAEKMFRPTIVLSVENGMAHGSARSIPNFHLLDALESCRDLFEQFGGHAAAAGMTLKTENIERLRDALNKYAKDAISDEMLEPELLIDAPVAPTTLTLELHTELSRLEPFGAGNRKPVLITKGLRLRFEPTVMKEKHLKLYLQDGTGNRFEAVWWDGVERGNGRTLTVGQSIEVAYTLDANQWQGNVKLQLVVEDIREHN